MNFLRTFTPSVCLFALFLPTQTARAQVSIYGTGALTNYCLSNNDTNTCKSDGGGLIGGMFYNFPIQSRLTAGIDIRSSYSFGPRGGTLTAAALRVGFVPQRVALRPYFQLGGGVASSTFTIGQITGPATQGLTSQPTRYTSGILLIAAGLDIRLTDSLDLRALELGAAASGSSPSAGSAFLDTGVVYHFHRRSPKS